MNWWRSRPSITISLYIKRLKQTHPKGGGKATSNLSSWEETSSGLIVNGGRHKKGSERLKKFEWETEKDKYPYRRGGDEQVKGGGMLVVRQDAWPQSIKPTLWSEQRGLYSDSRLSIKLETEIYSLLELSVVQHFISTQCYQYTICAEDTL